MFYKGVSLSNTQEATRNLVQEISDDIQFYNVKPTIFDGYFCIGDHRYVYKEGVQVGSGNPDDYGIVRETMSTCKTVVDPPPLGQAVDLNKAEKLLDPGMQLNDLVIKPVNGGIQVKILVVFYGGDNGVFRSETPGYVNDPNDSNYATKGAYKAPDAKCTGLPSSSQFCATASYQTTILQSF